MQKTILITGATDGIGHETAKALTRTGHQLLVHGRDAVRLAALRDELAGLPGAGPVETHIADLSSLADVTVMAHAVLASHRHIDCLINNAGVLRAANNVSADGLDLRFAVNTVAPYLLTKLLMPALDTGSRVINLSSAAQAPVNISQMTGLNNLDDMGAYAQSKLAITMWSTHMASAVQESGPIVLAVNPGSLLGTKMVKDAFGTAGKDIQIGADILVRAAVSDEFANASGKYFDNDSGKFAAPHPDALDIAKCATLVTELDAILAKHL